MFQDWKLCMLLEFHYMLAGVWPLIALATCESVTCHAAIHVQSAKSKLAVRLGHTRSSMIEDL